MLGEVDVFAVSGALSPVNGRKRGAGCGETGLERCLVAVWFERGQLSDPARSRERASPQPPPWTTCSSSARQFGIRPGLPEWRYRHRHQRRMLCAQRLWHQVELCCCARGYVVDEQVCVREQLSQRRSAVRTREVHNHAALVRVDCGEQPAHLASGRVVRVIRIAWCERPSHARPVALGRFDLDDVGTEIGEQLGRPWCSHHLAQLDDADAVETVRGHQVVGRSFDVRTGAPGPRAPLGLRAKLDVVEVLWLKATRA